MLIFLYGPNSYSRSKKLKEIIDVYREKNGGVAIPRFDLSNEKDEIDFFEFMSSVSIFDKKKAVVADEIFESSKKKDLKKIFQENLEEKDSVIVALSAVKPPAAFSFLLEKPVVVQSFSDIKDQEDIEKFVQTEARSRGLKLDGQRAATIASIFGKDLWAISTELDSLSLSPLKEVGQKDTEEYFKLLNSFKFGRSTKDKLVALEMLLGGGSDSARVFNGLAFGSNSQAFINKLADYDVMVKSGKLEYEEVLVDLALSD